MTKTNPNNANQHVLDPRQKLCWEKYINPKSKTFGNAYQSAVEVGYEKVYAKVITTRPWFEDKVRRLGLLSKAEKVLEDMLEMNTETTRKTEDGDEVTTKDSGLVRIKQDTAKFIASTQGKDKGYSTRSEVTGKDGKDLIPDKESEDKANKAIKNYLNEPIYQSDTTGDGQEADKISIPVQES